MEATALAERATPRGAICGAEPRSWGVTGAHSVRLAQGAPAKTLSTLTSTQSSAVGTVLSAQDGETPPVVAHLLDRDRSPTYNVQDATSVRLTFAVPVDIAGITSQVVNNGRCDYMRHILKILIEGDQLGDLLTVDEDVLFGWKGENGRAPIIILDDQLCRWLVGENTVPHVSKELDKNLDGDVLHVDVLSGVTVARRADPPADSCASSVASCRGTEHGPDSSTQHRDSSVSVGGMPRWGDPTFAGAVAVSRGAPEGDIVMIPEVSDVLTAGKGSKAWEGFGEGCQWIAAVMLLAVVLELPYMVRDKKGARGEVKVSAATKADSLRAAFTQEATKKTWEKLKDAVHRRVKVTSPLPPPQRRRRGPLAPRPTQPHPPTRPPAEARRPRRG